MELSSVFSIEKDSRNSIWIGTDKGVVRIRENRIEHISQDNYLSNNAVLTIVERTEGEIFTGTYRGINIIYLDENK